jgi:two-component system cell cycle sensor histidine kinase/response regulator CckA
VIALDMRTVLLSYVLSNAICAVVIYSLWAVNRRSSAGLGFWLADFGIQFCAVLLIALRGVVPVSISILLGSPLVIAGTILLYMGLERYTGKNTSSRFNYGFLAAFCLFHVYFTVFQPSLNARNVGLSVALLVICGQCAWLTLRRADPAMRPIARAVGGVFVLYCVASFGRITVDLLVRPMGNDVFTSGLYDTLVIMIYQMLFVGLTFSLFLMVNRRLFASLERDIQERELTEGALRRSERKFALAFQTSPYAITITRARDGKLMEVNDAFSTLTGFTREEAIGRPTNELGLWVEEEDRDRVVSELLSGRGVVGREFRFRRKDGGIITGSFSADVIQLDEEPCILSSIEDVTERRRADAERERLMAAIEQAGEAMMVTDPEGIILYVNPAFERITGYARGEALGRTPSILKSGEQDLEFYRVLWETISSGRTWEGRFVNRRKDGALYTEDATISPVCDAGGRIVNHVAVKRDITNDILLAARLQQAQKLESIGMLAGGVAHDFNNMLGVIIGFADLAMEKLDPVDPLHADLEEILKAAHRSADVTRQLLAFARRQTITPRVIDLNTTMGGMLRMLRRLIGEDVDLSWRPGAGLWPVKMDPSQLDQVMANLCVNARDAIAGVGTVTIETRNVSLDETQSAGGGDVVPGDYVLLAVSDDGRGLDKETLERIFEPFFTTKEIGQGTGLGLATVYGIVKQNDGFVNVYSEPGKGTTLEVYLPRHSGEMVGAQVQPAPEIPPGRGETVLVVEDEVSILQIAGRILDRLGYAVLTANTPGEAIRLAKTHAGDIHLVISDVIMPEMDGRKLVRHLLALRPDIKCLFMSGYTANVVAHRGVLDEGVHFIQKPFSAGELAVAVRAALDQG